MPIQVLMPALSPTMEKGNLAKWVKGEGDKIKSGDIIAEIETDKATMEVEATDEGTLGKILIPEGTADVAVNTPIAVILSDGEDASALKNAGAAVAAPTRAIPARAGAEDADAPAIPASVAPLQPQAAPETDVPAGTEMTTMTVREALRDAMAEEMRRDGDVFVIGEEVAEYQGAYKVTQGLLQEFGDRRVIDTPITEHGFTGLGVGAGLAGPQAHRRVHDLQFRHAGDRPGHQLRRQDALHVRRPARLLDRVPRPQRAGRARRRPAQPGLHARGIRSVPGLTVVAPYTAADAKGLLKSAIRYPNPVVFLENEILYGHSFPVPKLDDYLVPIGKAKVVRPGEQVTIVAWSMGMALCAQGRRGTRQGKHQRRDHRPAHHPPDGYRDHRPLDRKDRPLRGGGGGLGTIRRRRRDRGAR